MTCSICLVDMELTDTVCGLEQCGHVFHKQCIEAWFAAAPRPCCPLCRREVSGNDCAECVECV
jgi:E3 ubiquitin-protein ligase ATL41